MRLLGFASLALIVISFLLWLVGWVYWNFLAGVSSYGSVVAKVMQGTSFLGSLLEYLAILLIAIGLIIAAGRVSGGSKHTDNH